MARQYVAVVFKEGSRPYTYHNDGEPLAITDIVRVEARGGAAISATVVGITDEPPPFETKAIIGLAEAAEAQFQDQKEQ